MKKNKYDVIIAGAGPAGSLCARDLARSGFDVLLCEKRDCVGVPVRCGEATGNRQGLSRYVEVNESYIETDLQGMVLHTPGNSIGYRQPNLGLMVNRDLFDRDLAEQAVRAGAELSLQSRVAAIDTVSEGLRKVRVHSGNREFELGASVVVGADGAESLCGRMAGLDCRQRPSQTCSTIEYKIKGEYQPQDSLSFWAEYGGVKWGYIWVFPKVKSGLINVGAGIITPKLNQPRIEALLKSFMKEKFPRSKIREVCGGAVPVSGNLKTYTAERLLLAGDAAHHTNPLTGGGIFAAMQSGTLAAGWIEKAFNQNEFGAEFFRQYEGDCWKAFGRDHRRQLRIRDFLLNLPPEDETTFFHIIRSLADSGFSPLAKVTGYPKFLPLVLRNWRLIRQIYRKTR